MARCTIGFFNLCSFVSHKMYDWLLERHQAASEEITDLSNIRGKYQRHQAFEAELAASKDKLDQIKEVCTNT
jgi:hypothetical protein